MVNPKTKVCSTLAGTGSPGLVDGSFELAQFSEPSGVCMSQEGNALYVADTNNHAIRILDLKEKKVSRVINSILSIRTTLVHRIALCIHNWHF